MKLTNEDENTLIECSVRYALGRRTYIVGEICRIVRDNINNLSNRAICVIERDIRTFSDCGEYDGDYRCYGDRCDIEEWSYTLAVLQEAIKERGLKPW